LTSTVKKKAKDTQGSPGEPRGKGRNPCRVPMAVNFEGEGGGGVASLPRRDKGLKKRVAGFLKKTKSE